MQRWDEGVGAQRGRDAPCFNCMSGRSPERSHTSPASGEEGCEAPPTNPPRGQEQRRVAQRSPGLGLARDARRAAQGLWAARTTRAQHGTFMLQLQRKDQTVEDRGLMRPKQTEITIVLVQTHLCLDVIKTYSNGGQF